VRKLQIVLKCMLHVLKPVRKCLVKIIVTFLHNNILEQNKNLVNLDSKIKPLLYVFYKQHTVNFSSSSTKEKRLLYILHWIYLFILYCEYKMYTFCMKLQLGTLKKWNKAVLLIYNDQYKLQDSPTTALANNRVIIRSVRQFGPLCGH